MRSAENLSRAIGPVSRGLTGRTGDHLNQRACLISIWQDEYHYLDSVYLRKIADRQHNSVFNGIHNPNVVGVLDF